MSRAFSACHSRRSMACSVTGRRAGGGTLILRGPRPAGEAFRRPNRVCVAFSVVRLSMSTGPPWPALRGVQRWPPTSPRCAGSPSACPFRRNRGDTVSLSPGRSRVSATASSSPSTSGVGPTFSAGEPLGVRRPRRVAGLGERSGGQAGRRARSPVGSSRRRLRLGRQQRQRRPCSPQGGAADVDEPGLDAGRGDLGEELLEKRPRTDAVERPARRYRRTRR